jgi:SAM-dependent methyltransferase
MNPSAGLGPSVTDLVDVDELRSEVREKYREVAADPSASYHFHTGRAHALRMGYPAWPLSELPEEATAAFAGVGNPFFWSTPAPGETVLDLGTGGGMDAFLSSIWVGPQGRVIGIDMTEEMLARASATAESLGMSTIEFRSAYIEELPIESNSVDVVISNGVINLCPDKMRVYSEIARVLKPGGRMTIADICVEKPVPQGALNDIDLWTG